MKTKETIALADQYIMGTYKRFPLVLVRGRGMLVWDNDGKEYLDFVAGIAVCSLGHSHPRVVEAIQKQAETLMHVSNLYYIEPQARFAKLLVDHSFADKVFFCNSGAEANEGAIKLARKYSRERMGAGKDEIIAMEESFHGRTLAAITATGQPKYQAGFDPLPAGFKHVPFNDVQALEEAVTERTCAILVEPIQGEGGIRIPSADYLREVRRICDKRSLLMILDEVQVGIGRTGSLFAYEHDGVKPDIMTLAKALGNGFPLGALLATDAVASVFVPGTHASTFGGNPLAMAAGLATLETIFEEGVLENCRNMGDYFIRKLKSLQKKYDFVKEVRGRGLMIGVEIDIDGPNIVNRCMSRGLLINCTSANVLRFVPPLIIMEADIDRGVLLLDEVFGEVAKRR